MQRWISLAVVAALVSGLAACGDADDPEPGPVVAAGAPQGPAPRVGLRGGDLPTGGTLTGAPATALARLDDTVYATGVDWVAPLRGSALALRPQTGSLARAFGTNGRIAEAVADGSGGVFLAGDFDRVGSRRRQGLVHLFATGEVDRRFRPEIDGLVVALALDGGILYAGGAPDGPRGPGVRGVVALNAGTGKPLPGFETDVAPGVTELALREGTLYAGGAAPGLRRSAERSGADEAPVVALDGRSGERVPAFAPAPLEGERRAITALRIIDGRLWVGSSGSGPSGRALRLLDPDTGATEEEPAVRGTVHELLRDDGRVIAVGGLRGRTGRELAQALDPATGARRPGWAVRADGRGTVAYDGLLRGATLWLGGARRTAGAPAGFVGAYALRGGATRAEVTAPDPDGPVAALASAGGRVVAGGDFTAAGVRRQDLMAFNATTGRYAAGARLPRTRDAGALAAAGGRLWVAERDAVLVVDPASGGVVARIAVGGGGAGRVRLAAAGGRVFVAGTGRGGAVSAYDAVTGARVAFRLPRPVADGRPPALLGDGDTLWLGGRFERTATEGGPRPALLKLDARTGTADERFAPRIDGPVRALRLIDDRLYLAGRFTRVGELRRSTLAAVDPATGAAVADFEPGRVRADGAVTLERLGSALLVIGAAGSRAYDADGGPAPRTVNGASRVSATAPGAGDSQLVAGALRDGSTAADPRRRGVVLPPRG